MVATMKAEENSRDMVQETVSSSIKVTSESVSGGKTGEGPPCAAQVEIFLEIPAQAVLSQAAVRILALPAGECPLNEAGELRLSPEDKKKVIIDLKRMRSVAGLNLPQSIETIDIWTGAGFNSSGLTFSNKKKVFFSEIATERLLVTLTANAIMEDLTATGTVLLPDAPADLVLSVNDKTAWTHIGAVKLAVPESPSSHGTLTLDAKAKESLVAALLEALNDIPDNRHSEKECFKILEAYGIILSAADTTAFKALLSNKGKARFARTEQALEEWLATLGVTWEGREVSVSPCFSETVDITRLLQNEINAGAASVKIVLRAALACRLELTLPTLDYLLSHSVVFPAQALALEIPEECRTTLSLPLPVACSSWLARKILFTLDGNAGPSRIFPATGPEASCLGELVLDGEHALAALLTADFLAGLTTIEGVRLPLLIEEGGAEITASLRLDEDGKVGAPLAAAVFRSQTLDQASTEQWVLLELDKPVDVQSGKGFWLELNGIRGKCWWQLGGPEAAEGVVPLQRGLPGGTFSNFALTLNGQTRNLQGRLRLKGRPVTDGTLPAIRPFDPQSEKELPGLTPGTAPLHVELAFENAVQPKGGQLDVPLVFYAPGTYTITEARVIYEVKED